MSGHYAIINTRAKENRRKKMFNRPKTATISHVQYATSYRFFVTFSDTSEEYRSDIPFDPYYKGKAYDEAYSGISDALKAMGYGINN